MGYRLGIYKTELSFYGTKLYGYEDNIEEFKSYKYLIEHNLIEDFNFGCSTQILMTGNMLKEFIKLYNDDLNNYATYIKLEKDNFINRKEIKELLKCRDYDYYVIDWG